MKFATPKKRSTVGRRIGICSFLGVLSLVFIAPHLERHLSRWALEKLIDQAHELDITVTAENLSVNLFSLYPSIRVEKLSAAAIGYDPIVEYVDAGVTTKWWAIVGSVLSIEDISIGKLRINYLVDDSGEDNLRPVIESLLEYQTDDSQVVNIRNINLRNGELEYINDLYSHSGLFNLNVHWEADDTEVNSNLTAIGDINHIPFSVETQLNALLASSPDPKPGNLTLSGKLDDLSLEIAASTDDVRSLENTKINAILEGEKLNKTLSKLNLELTAVSEISLDGKVQYNVNDVLNADVDMQLDNSSAVLALHTQGLYDEAEQSNKRIVGSLSAENLFIDTIFLPASEINFSDKKSNVGTNEQLFSDKKILSQYGLDDVVIDFNTSVDSLYSGNLRVNGLFASINADENGASVSIKSEDVGQGQFRSDYVTGKGIDSEKGKFSARFNDIPIEDVLSALDAPDGLIKGKLSGDANFWVAGESPAELAGGLDGSMFMLIEDGNLDSLLVEMAGIDLMESISLVLKNDIQHSEIRCGYINIEAEQGQLSLEEFIIDTEDSVLELSGGIDLAEENLNIKFSPYPRDASFLAATTPVHILGPMSNPKIRPGRKLYTRLAMAAALATLAGPAAIVLPFVQIGDGGKKSYCTELFGK